MGQGKFSVCLINPPVLAVIEPWYDRPDFGRTGLAYLAGFLRQYEEYEVSIIDAKFEQLDFHGVLSRVLELNPDIIGYTAFTNEIKPAAYMAGLIKSKLPNIVNIIGGVHVTAIPRQTLEEFPSFDFGVIGEGEVTLYELCEAVRLDLDLTKVNGIIYRKDAQHILTPSRDRISDQDSIPLPAWDLLPPAKTYYVQSIRGCPFNCLFCMNPNGKIARLRSVENVIAELNLIIEKYQPERISFGDELFSVNIERTKALLIAMANNQIGEKVKWDVQTHVNYVNDEIFELFKKANVERVELGIETGDELKLKKMGKGTSLNDIISACNSAKKIGVKIGIFLLFGQPNETVESINKTINIAAKINPEIPMFGLMTPYPGTEIARYAANNEFGYRLLSTDWDEYNKQIGGALEFANLNRRQIEWLQIKAYLIVYLKNYRIKDLLQLIWEYRGGAWEVFKKVIFNKSSLDEVVKKPTDYEEIIASEKKITPEVLVSARSDWKEYQQKSMKQLKKIQTK